MDNKDRPIEDIVIQKAHVFVDPFEEVDEQLAKDRMEEAEKEQKTKQEQEMKKIQNKPLIALREGVGKYLNKDAVKQDLKSETSAELAKRAKIAKRYDFGDFKTW